MGGLVSRVVNSIHFFKPFCRPDSLRLLGLALARPASTRLASRQYCSEIFERANRMGH